MSEPALSPAVRSLLLVRNGVDHDARVLRAARVAERALGGPALVLGVATASSPVGVTRVEGVEVLRLPPRIGMHRRATNTAVREADPTSQKTTPVAPALSTSSRLTLAGRARRILGGVSFALQALSLARRVRPELVHANDWNTMWSGLAIKLMCRTRLIYDSHELWADRNGRWEWRWWLLISEALFTRAADAAVTASPGYAEVLQARYRIPRPTVIRNIPEDLGATDVQDGRLSANGVSAIEPSVPEPLTEPLLVYVGGLIPGRGLEQTIDALAFAPGARLRAIGPGSDPYRAALAERARRIGVGERLELCPPVPPALVGAALAQATAGLCLIQPVCRSYELTLPNKLFEYAAAGVPVLASDLPVIAAVVREQGLGEVVPPEDPRKIAEGLLRLSQPDRWNAAARRARTFAQASDWSTEAQLLAEVYLDASPACAAKMEAAPEAAPGAPGAPAQAIRT